MRRITIEIGKFNIFLLTKFKWIHRLQGMLFSRFLKKVISWMKKGCFVRFWMQIINKSALPTIDFMFKVKDKVLLKLDIFKDPWQWGHCKINLHQIRWHIAWVNGKTDQNTNLILPMKMRSRLEEQLFHTPNITEILLSYLKITSKHRTLHCAMRSRSD